MRPSIAARLFWSFSTSKKPPQLADTRFQILGIWDGDFRWHCRKIIKSQRIAKVHVEAMGQALSSSAGSVSYTTRAELLGFWLCSARRLETENRFAFLHQIESIARNRFQIGRRQS